MRHSFEEPANFCTQVTHVYTCNHTKVEKAACAVSKRTDCKTLNKRTVNHSQKCSKCGGG